MNDDQLTRDLATAFRDATADLTYDGRVPTPRRNVALAVPITAAAAAAIVIPASLGGGGAAPTLAGPSVSSTSPAGLPASSAPSATTGPAPRVVHEKVELAGFTLRYTRSSAEQGTLVARSVDAVPDDATPVELVDSIAKAWVGVDPTTGDNATFVQSPSRNGGRLFSLSGPGWTQDQLVDLLKHGSVRTVPYVEE